jgi:putative redox protein
MQKTTVSFKNRSGQTLSGILDQPLAEPRAYALFAHCFTCSKNLKSATNISRALTDAGFAVLRFDFAGLGQSEGEFADTTFSSNVDDLLAAARFLEQEYAPPAVLVGHSLGGTAVLQAAGEISSAVAVATIGSPADPAHVEQLFAGSRDEMAARGYAEVNLGGRPFTIRQQFVDDLGRHDLPASIGGLRRALLVMHAPLDATVDIENASALFTSAKHPKSFVSLDTADHLLSREEDSLYAGRVLAAWSSRYLPVASAGAGLPAEGDAAARTFSGGFRTDLRVGAHSMTADEPASVGGTDAGPSPYGLLSAALASCTSMTLRMYADFKKLDLRSATTAVTHRKIHAEDCADCENTDGRVDEFRRVITLAGDLTDDQRERMLEIADRCPVHRTLHGTAKVRSTLAD